jgi:hypothetical protein
VEQHAEPAHPDLVEGEHGLGQRLAVRAGREEEGQAAAVQHAQGERDVGVGRAVPARGRRRLLREQGVHVTAREAAEHPVQPLRAEAPQVVARLEPRLAQLAEPGVDERVAVRLQQGSRLLEGGGERVHVCTAGFSAR